jgi:hypothetical protein
LRLEEPVITTLRLPVLCCALLGLASSASASAAAAANAAGNPYSFYGSVAECAAAQRDRCAECAATGTCTAITDLGNGNDECALLTANGGRGEYLICVNLALAIDAVASCAARSAPSCRGDTAASASFARLAANAAFVDAAACAAPLDACLAALYGASGPGFPGPGSGGSGSPRPRRTSISCDDSLHDDPNCDGDLECDADEMSCDAPYDGTCEDSNEQSGCSDSGADGGGSCSSDGAGDSGGGDSCSGDGADGGGDCSSGDGGDCSSGDGGDCSSGDGGGCSVGGGGADCSGGGGGGDCSGGGGGDCNVASGRGHTGVGLPVAIAWALLPLPFATIVRRRAERRRARTEADAEARADAGAEGRAP